MRVRRRSVLAFKDSAAVQEATSDPGDIAWHSTLLSLTQDHLPTPGTALSASIAKAARRSRRVVGTAIVLSEGQTSTPQPSLQTCLCLFWNNNKNNTSRPIWVIA